MIEGYVLSPANLYWIRRSGERTLLSQKADFLNFDLIAKLQSQKQKIEAEDLIPSEFIDEISSAFAAHRREVQIKDKIQWRKRLLFNFKKRLLSGENSQFEIDQVMWKIFSKFNIELTKSFLDKDIDLFKRSMSIASSYTLMAFVMGYYNDDFLTVLFNQIFSDLFNVSPQEPLISLKERLETLRGKDTLGVEEVKLLERFYRQKSHLFNERFDGSGSKQIHYLEMTDLEKLLVALNAHFSFKQDPESNILFQMRRGEFNCDEKVLKLILQTLDRQSEDKKTDEGPVLEEDVAVEQLGA